MLKLNDLLPKLQLLNRLTMLNKPQPIPLLLQQVQALKTSHPIRTNKTHKISSSKAVEAHLEAIDDYFRWLQWPKIRLTLTIPTLAQRFLQDISTKLMLCLIKESLVIPLD